MRFGSGTIVDLIAPALARGSRHREQDAITRALIALYDRAMQARVTPSTTSHDQLCFLYTIKRSTIETLVSLGWLHADQQDDLGAIVAAFRGFAGRSLAVARNGGRDRWYLP